MHSSSLTSPRNALQAAVAQSTLTLDSDTDALPCERGAGVFTDQYDATLLSKYSATPINLGFLAEMMTHWYRGIRFRLPRFVVINPMAVDNKISFDGTGRWCAFNGLTVEHLQGAASKTNVLLASFFMFALAAASHLLIRGFAWLFAPRDTDFSLFAAHPAWTILSAGFGVAIFGFIIISIYASSDQPTITIPLAFKAGRIPTAIRQLILSASKSCDFDSISLIYEADKSTYQLGSVKVTPVPRPDPDPILVGIRHGRAYLLATFDLTPLERARVREFGE